MALENAQTGFDPCLSALCFCMSTYGAGSGKGVQSYEFCPNTRKYAQPRLCVKCNTGGSGSPSATRQCGARQFQAFAFQGKERLAWHCGPWAGPLR